MATFNSDAVVKNLTYRANSSGQEATFTGAIKCAAGSSFALADVLNFMILGENQRPVRIILEAEHLSGTPVLTNPTFNIGVAPYVTTTFKRADETTYPPTPVDVDQLSAALVIPADKMATDTVVARPVADAVSKYAPYYVTVQPAGAGAFSVAGGDILLKLTVECAGERRADSMVYTQYMNTKVKN